MLFVNGNASAPRYPTQDGSSIVRQCYLWKTDLVLNCRHFILPLPPHGSALLCGTDARKCDCETELTYKCYTAKVH